MDVDHGAQLLGLGPERRQLRIAEFQSAGGRRNADPAQSEFAHAALEFDDRERRHMQRQGAEPDQPVRPRRHRPADPVVGGAGEPQAGLRIGPFQALVDQARGQHLDVDTHRVHLGEAVRQIAHAGKHQPGALPDLVAHVFGDARIGRKLGKDVVLRRHPVDFRHQDVRMKVDHGAARTGRSARRCLGHSLPCPALVVTTLRYNRIVS